MTPIRLVPLERLSASVQRVERPLAVLFAIALLLDCVLWAYVGARQRALPDLLPIHYNSAGQVDRIGAPGQLFMLPVIGLSILALNTGLAYWAYRRERQLTYVLLALAILVQLLLAGAAIQLIH